MLSYLKQTQAKLLVIILFDLILLALLTIPLIVTEMPDIIYTQFWNMSNHPLMYSYHSIYQILIKIQFPLLLALIIYLFSGKRYTQMIKVLGKNKVIVSQAFLLLITLPVGFLIQSITSQLLLDYNFMWASPYFIWLVAVGGILIYHLVFFSNLRYRNFLIQGAFYFSILLFGFLIYTLTTTTGRYYNFSTSYLGVAELQTQLVSISQIPFNSLVYDFTNLLCLVGGLLTVSLVAYIENMKVGKL